ncbi:MAG: rhomboid family intramembrane serine protease, partial [Kofleriaceae bacterium]
AGRPWSTVTLTAGLLGLGGAIWVAVGPPCHLGVLLRAGAMVHGLVDAGEWWRLVSCVVVHVGVVHLLVNAVGTYVLARAAEELFGTARTIALFGLSGLAGSLASYLAPHPGVSAGASGAVFGVLGAVFVELTLHRERYRAAWKRGMWGGLALVAVAQVGVGFLYPMVDQRAHIGGLLGGVAFGALLSPTARWHQLGLHAGRVLAVGFVALLGVSAALVVRTTVADSFDRAPRVRRTVGDIAVTAPATWAYDHELSDGDGFVNATFQRVPLDLGAPQLDQWVEAAHQIGKQRGMEQVEPAAAPLIALPAGWRGKELIGTFEDALGHRQRYRLIAVGRAFGDSFVVALVFTPESVAAADPALFAALIGSIEPA